MSIIISTGTYIKMSLTVFQVYTSKRHFTGNFIKCEVNLATCVILSNFIIFFFWTLRKKLKAFSMKFKSQLWPAAIDNMLSWNNIVFLKDEITPILEVFISDFMQWKKLHISLCIQNHFIEPQKTSCTIMQTTRKNVEQFYN